MNIEWSRAILKELIRAGVREVIFCAGARNSPLVAVLEQTSGISLHSFFEERSAAFFALGASRREARPVAVITTSGTAVAELLPATVEAFHTGVPLLLVTADRPRRLRGTGAPQAIDQTGIFAKFIEKEFDLESGDAFSLDGWHRRAPVHINVCFDEPLLDAVVEPLELQVQTDSLSYLGTSNFAVSATPEWGAMRLAKFLRASGTRLTVVGMLETQAEREAVVELLLLLKSPVYLEGTSGLREDPRLRDLALRSGDRVLAWALKKNLLDRVLRVGGVPTVRIWRDLEEPSSHVDVLSLTNLPFAGLSRGEMVCAPIAPTLQLVASELNDRAALSMRSEAALALLTKDREVETRLVNLIEREPKSEPALIHALSKLVYSSEIVYIGNSLPIREWDLAATRELSPARRSRPIEANRGVNGIDGQVSTFLGLAREHQDNWCILGDLTALYDLAAPWALMHRLEARVHIVVVNNGGGKIFSRIFNRSLFENRHALGFAGWAQMWNLGYQKWTEVPSSFQSAGSSNGHSPGESHRGATPGLPAGAPAPVSADLIELVPDDAATSRFWIEHDSWWA